MTYLYRVKYSQKRYKIHFQVQHTYTHGLMDTYTHIYTHTHIFEYTHTHIHTYSIHTHTYTHTHILYSTCIHTHILYTHTHTHIHTYTYTHIHTYTHTRTVATPQLLPACTPAYMHFYWFSTVMATSSRALARDSSAKKVSDGMRLGSSFGFKWWLKGIVWLTRSCLSWKW